MKHVILIGLVVLLAACGDDAPSAPQSPPRGTACTTAGCAADCCTGHCDELSGLCSRVRGTCVAAGDDCSVGPDCCSLSCVDFKCSGNQCTSDNQSCGQDGECCSGVCSGHVRSAQCRVQDGG